jgi:serine/threonine protein kinase
MLRSQITEPIVWLVLRNVYEGLYDLEARVDYKCKAEREDADEDVKGKEETGRPMLHRDIKPSNIFLKQPSSPFDSYPHPWLLTLMR